MVLPIWWVGSRLTQSYMEKWIFCCLEVSVGISLRLMQSWEWIWICGIVLGFKDIVQWVIGAQWGSGVSLMAHSMRDPVWLETNQPIWQNLERRDCFLLTLSRHKNIETSQCTISKNGWVLPFFVILTPVTKKLQFTVFLDHPVFRATFINYI